ncbi:hypothetical protein CANCADRAFT_44376 [Tortispora caseinolytica NRRL Y-17796]|uniref:Transcriptional regulatory protein RXT2 N-terminal domain-containing protein n=1 Tax=Tortispora caseinolytica NRRL Y-17796 TaxID=767744 RepID=A0A1E4TGD4_9ASCO|nr:hypothetical protein CANCADRAFT_44376 [Tortispora caseinolytica NRRL Y-17796]
MVEEDPLEEIGNLKEALVRNDDGSDSDSSIGEATSNRGNKLKVNAKEVHEGKLWKPYSSAMSDKPLEFANKKRKVLKAMEFDENGEESDIDKYLAENIKIEKVLAPLSDFTDILTHPSISRSYKSENITLLARRIIDITFSEKENYTRLLNLLDILLSDDIPPVFEDLPEIFKSEKDGNTIDAVVESTVEDIITKTENDIEPAQDNSNSKEEEAIVPVRNLRSNIDDSSNIDPFYGIPRSRSYVDLRPDAADELKQLAQMAVQRSHEYISLLDNVADTLMKTDKYRLTLLSWAEELAQADLDKSDKETD